jgi:hypothetical protein
LAGTRDGMAMGCGILSLSPVALTC